MYTEGLVGGVGLPGVQGFRVHEAWWAAVGSGGRFQHAFDHTQWAVWGVRIFVSLTGPVIDVDFVSIAAGKGAVGEYEARGASFDAMFSCPLCFAFLSVCHHHLLAPIPPLTRNVSSYARTQEAATPNRSPAAQSFKTDAGAIAGSVIGGVALGTTIATFFVWFYTSHKSSHPVTQKSPQTSEVTILSSPSPPIAPTQSESQPVPQNPYDPDDIPTATTIPRVRTDSEATLMSKMFSTTEPFWGQVGQYYHGVPEV
ncbi:hypothetical protein F5887DRAFT_1161365 [Amanita rubescens]|nr:hypothetical protein F5887DRAFT_1161365 [Amanita rubescens]